MNFFHEGCILIHRCVWTSFSYWSRYVIHMFTNLTTNLIDDVCKFSVTGINTRISTAVIFLVCIFYSTLVKMIY